MQICKTTRFLLNLLLITLATAAPALAQSDAAKPNVMLILDSSRSMWGQIDGINKVVSARTVLAQISRQYASKVKLGLVAYGHRESSGCDDIEVVLPLGEHTPKQVTKRVKAITPKGSTPIAKSLQSAAKAAGYKDKPATLVLLADGLDNCKGNPCETAGQLEKGGDDLTIHVVAFDRKTKSKLTKLSCVAEQSGGTFASATSEEQLLRAFETVMASVVSGQPEKIVANATPDGQLVTIDEASSAGMSDPETTAAIPDRRPIMVAPEPGETEIAQSTPTMDGAPVPISLRALLTEAGPEIKSGLVWRIFDTRPDQQGQYTLISTHREATPTAALAPGDYLVNAAFGLSYVTKKMTVAAGVPQSETLVLNAGGLRLASVLANGESIPPNSVRYDILADETDQFGNRETILRDAKPGLIIRLNAGAYHVVSVYGDANAIVRADVTIEPGKLTEATVNHSAARATFKLVLQPGGEALPDTQWNILTPGGDVVKESAGALPSHILAAGSYTVLARYKDKNYSREFKLEPGEDLQIEVVIR